MTTPPPLRTYDLPPRTDAPRLINSMTKRAANKLPPYSPVARGIAGSSWRGK